jgi:hypothetical protein
MKIKFKLKFVRKSQMVLRSVLAKRTIGLLVIALTMFIVNPVSVLGLSKGQGQSFQFTEGKVSSSVFTIGPFDLHRKYRSMEGPYALLSFRVGDIVASKRIDIPEAMIKFVEGDHSAPGMMNSSSGPQPDTHIPGIIDTSKQSRTLLWLKGIKLEVLDEKDHVLPTAEFICHCNVDTSANFRNIVFSQAERCPTNRLVTITQGQTEITFPEGYGVPVASDEPWTVIYQAANRTTDKHRRVKHRCTFYFIKDSDLVYPIKALNWYAPIVYVSIDNSSAQVAKQETENCLSCIGTSSGVNAPNNVSNGTFVDHKGRRMSGHWVVPPGNHSYCATIDDDREPGFAVKSRILHAVWSHVHPLCTNFSLYECRDHSRVKIYSVAAKTETRHGLEIKEIDYWSSKKGVLLPAKDPYELEITYKNGTKVPQDSMASAGMFFEDNIFVRPDWVFAGKNGYSCVVGANNSPLQKGESKQVTLVKGSPLSINKSEPVRPEANSKSALDMEAMLWRSLLVIGSIVLLVLVILRLRGRK